MAHTYSQAPGILTVRAEFHGKAENSSFLTYVVLGSFAFKDTKRGCCKNIAAARISLRKASFWLF